MKPRGVREHQEALGSVSDGGSNEVHVGRARAEQASGTGATRALPRETTVGLTHGEVRGPDLSDVWAQRAAVQSWGDRDPSCSSCVADSGLVLTQS